MKVISVNTSPGKGTPKKPVSEASLIEGLGIKGDAHAGPGDRQVSLLAIESYRRFEEKGLGKICLKHGSFGENIITEGIELHKLEIGKRMRIGDVLLEVSKIGKECHAPCNIARTVGDCIMPREGIFATVVKGGIIKQGNIIRMI